MMPNEKEIRNPPAGAVCMRLDRYLAVNSELSRSQAQRAIRAGRVQVNGEPVTDVACRVGDRVEIKCDGVVINQCRPRYFMLNKPVGVVCATRDDSHRTVLDLIKPEDRAGLHMAGRLDIDTTGLVLLTDDGEWSHRVASPRKRCPKSYLAQLADALTLEGERMLQGGVALRNEKRPTMSAVVERLGAREIRLTIHEGKYHQVKRMFAAVGNRVTSLHRERIGDISLDPELEPGDYRPLRPEEINSVG